MSKVYIVTEPTVPLTEDQTQRLDSVLAKVGARVLGYRILRDKTRELVVDICDLPLAERVAQSTGEQSAHGYSQHLLAALGDPKCADIWNTMDSVAWN